MSAELIKPLAIGDDVRKWHIRDRGRYLIFTRRGVSIDRYPAILAHLEKYRERLEPRPRDWDPSQPWSGRKSGSYRWYEIQDDVAYYKHFDNPKIVYPEISMDSRFSYDESGSFVNNKGFIIATTDLYLLGVLSSKTVWRYLQSVCSSIQGNALELKSTYLTTTPIPTPDNQTRSEIEVLVRSCLTKKGHGCHAEESLIEQKVRNLYGFQDQVIP